MRDCFQRQQHVSKPLHQLSRGLLRLRPAAPGDDRSCRGKLLQVNLPWTASSFTVTLKRIEVAYCTQAGYGTRVLPDGTLTGAHFVQTPDYVQVCQRHVMNQQRLLIHKAFESLSGHGLGRL